MNIWNFVLSFGWLPWVIMGLIGFILGWLLKPSGKVEGDLSLEGEGALRSENDALRARVAELEAALAAKDAEVSDLSGQVATANLTEGRKKKTLRGDFTHELISERRALLANGVLDAVLAQDPVKEVAIALHLVADAFGRSPLKVDSTEPPVRIYFRESL